MSKPEKAPVLMFANLSKSWGGGEKWMMTVAQAWIARGHSAELLVYPNSSLEKRLKEQGVPHHTIALRTLSWLNPAKMMRLAKILRQQKADVVFLNASHELKTVGVIAYQVGIQEIVFRRGVSYPISPNLLNRWLIRTVATRFLANSKATFDACVAAFPSLLQKPHLTLNNGINPSEWTPKPEAQVRGRIGLVARLSPEKGIERAILAMEEVSCSECAPQLWIIGEGKQQKELEALVVRNNLQEKVHFAGFNKDPQSILHTCEICVFTPHFGEGTSLVLIEAMLLALPCVVMDSPAMREVVVDRETGFVVADGDIPALANRLTTLLSDSGLRKNFGKAGRERAFQLFSLDRIIDALEDWF